MNSDVLIAEFTLLIFLYFKYFGEVVFISYARVSPNKREYQELAVELQKQLPEYKVSYGYFKPPGVVFLVVILAFEFYFKGLYKLIWKIFTINTRKMLITIGLLLLVTLAHLVEVENNFSISYEGHTVYSTNATDMEIPNADHFVDIIKKNATGLTFPRLVGLAGFLFAIRTFESSRRRWR